MIGSSCTVLAMPSVQKKRRWRIEYEIEGCEFGYNFVATRRSKTRAEAIDSLKSAAQGVVIIDVKDITDED